MDYKSKIAIIILLSLMIFLITGCGSSSLGKEATIINEVTNSNALKSGWMSFSDGGYSAARQAFATALENESDFDEEMRAKLYNGLGWATVRLEGFSSAGQYFQKAYKRCSDAKVGMAAYYLSDMDRVMIPEGIKLLESLNLTNAQYQYNFEYNPGVTNAQVHALMGLLYYFDGQQGKASGQFNVAGDIVNSPGEEISAQTVNAIINQFSL
ncbi:MAG: hypothetical protein C0601_09285 [Candidatus Muiribacterium halophilum]|uniref:Tetratricopeptide repeat-like domain-containing protein n=1 Tax=Muiribacterium halophilum TaxID=2053465 RepID=A0A2N5ZDN7_MUIH1|nr:MAG: hypothetical protein C0601_09285 [Candidatus Muirbacterium halophilum]